MWSKNGLVVTAKVADDGEVTIYGHDLSGAVYDEYEYWLTVPATGTPAITRALGGRPSDDVLSLLEANGEQIVRAGESTWLTAQGIDFGFYSWF